MNPAFSPVQTAVILAAGNGRRLHSGEGPAASKPLTRVGGVPLIVRTLVHLKRLGVQRVVVVTGYRGDELETTVRGDQRVADLDVVFAPNERWEQSNGLSVLAAQPHVQGEFLLLMADHVFQPELLRTMLDESARPDAGGAVLAIDRKISEVYDLDDATLVLTDQRGRISSIGKEITDYNAVDTGVFRCTEGLFSALNDALEERGDCSLSDGVQRLGDKGCMRTADVGEAWWQDVDTPGALKHAENLLFEACRKSVDGFVAKHLNRNISLAISRRIKNVPLSPNSISLMTFSLGILAAWAATHPDYWWFLAAAMLMKLNSILDGVDGELARVRLQESVLGQWLDTLSDDLSNLLFFAGLSLGCLEMAGGGHFAIAGGLAVVGQVGLSFLLYRELIAKGTGDLYDVDWDFDERPGASAANRVLSVLRYVVKKDFFILFFVLLAVCDLLPWCLYFAAAGALASFAAAAVRNLRVRESARAKRVAA